MTKMLPLLLCVGSITMSVAGKPAQRTSECRAQAGNRRRRCRKKGKWGLVVKHLGSLCGVGGVFWVWCVCPRVFVPWGRVRAADDP